MEFDKLKVYTAVNADELQIGSKCIFADTIKALRRKVQDEGVTDYVMSFVRLYNRGVDDMFVADDCYTYDYAYLIEQPT